MHDSMRWFICQKFGGLPLRSQKVKSGDGRYRWVATIHYSRAFEFKSKELAEAKLEALRAVNAAEFTHARWVVISQKESLRRRGMNLKRFGASPSRYLPDQFS